MEKASKILCVDDEGGVLRAIRRLFQDTEYELFTAESGREGLEILGREEIALIISDQRMPGMTGVEFLEQAKVVAPNAIRIMLTGYADIKDSIDAINRGAISRYISKPWNDDELIILVREAIERYDLARQNRHLTRSLQKKNSELAELSAKLEKMVEQRTRSLQLKVKELSGRDRILQHVLTVHPLAETLQVVLEVTLDVIGGDGAAFYLIDPLTEEMRLTAIREPNGEVALDLSPYNVAGGMVPSVFVPPLQQREIIVLPDPQGITTIASPFPEPCVVVPVRRKERLLGAMAVDRRKIGDMFSDDEVRMIQSLVMEAAIAIHDSLMHEQLPALEESLDQILLEMGK
ncbi:MAG: response regulator [Desulfobulbaceae bacterium]|nr:response regulator [Desulfobulbaceae bacterium]